MRRQLHTKILSQTGKNTLPRRGHSAQFGSGVISSQRRGELAEDPHGHRIFCLLDLAYVANARARVVGKLLLRQALGMTRLPRIGRQDRHQVHDRLGAISEYISTRHTLDSPSLSDLCDTASPAFYNKRIMSKRCVRNQNVSKIAVKPQTKLALQV